MNLDLDDDDAPSGTNADFDRKSAVDLLPRAALERALGTDGLERLKSEGSLCLVVQVPDESWVQPIAHCLLTIADFRGRITSQEKPRRVDKDTPSYVAKCLSNGEKVYGVSQDPAKMLPEVLIGASDLFVVLQQPDPALLGDIVRAVTGEWVDIDASCTRLTFVEIVTSIRRGSTAKQCRQRLSAMAVKSGARLSIKGAVLVDELVGYGEAKAWAQNLILDLSAWRDGKVDFDTIESRVVLAGPPGTGKTSFAKSVAHTAGIPIFATSAAAWFLNSNGYLDGVIKQIDAVFAAARDEAPAMVFIDEIDAVPDRRTLSSRGRDWWLPVVVHLLTLLDGASESNRNLVIVGATNYPERLDDALIRPGRLSRLIRIGAPTDDELKQILRQHLKNDLPDADLGRATLLMPGATGADVAEVVKRAKALARRENREIGVDDLVSVLAPVDDRPASVLERVAIHEAGHAVVSEAIGAGELRSISLVANGRVGGRTSFQESETFSTRVDAEKAVIRLLGGRAAEKVLLSSVGTGSGGVAESDLARATTMLATLHASHGLGPTLAYRGAGEAVASLLQLDSTFTGSVEAELQALHQAAEAIVAARAEMIRSVADALVDRRFLTRDDFLRIVAAHGGFDAP